MWSEYNLLVYMLIFDAVMGVTVPLEFILHEVRYRRELRGRDMSETPSLAPRPPSLRWPLVVVLSAGLVSTFAFIIYLNRPIAQSIEAPLKSATNSAPSPTPAQPVKQSQGLNIDDATKWQFSSTLRSTTLASDGHRLMCPFTINLSFQENGGGSYAKSALGLWTELQPMLDLAWWTPTSGRTQSRRHFQPGITILVGSDKGDAFTCATSLARQLQDFHISKAILRINQTTEDLADCHNECVELDIGDRDVP
jgi:hypothetical protein